MNSDAERGAQTDPLRAGLRNTSEFRRTAAVALLVFAGCYIGATAGVWLQFPVVGTAILFPPYAVLTAGLVLTPTRTWGVTILSAALGNFLPHYGEEGSLSFVALAEVANATRALVVAGALRLLTRGPDRLGTLRDMAFFLLFAAVIGPAAGAFIGAASAVLHGRAADFWLVWKAWMLSNTLTGLMLLPILLVGERLLKQIRQVRLRQLIEPALFSLAFLIVGIYVLTRLQPTSSFPAILFAPLLPLLLWGAVRFGPTGTAVALVAITALAIHGTFHGVGPFVGLSPAENFLQLQLFLICTSVPMLLLSAVVEQHEQAAAELQRSQTQYRSVVEDQTELICRYLADGTYTFVNQAYCRYFGRSAEELIGKTFWMFIPESDHPAGRAFLESLTVDNPVGTMEHEVLTPSGEIRWQQWTGRGLFDAEGSLIEYQGVGRDVTDRKRAEEEHRLLEAQRRVEEALRDTDRRKDEFLAMLAHELRNPLAPISMAVEIMRRQPASTPQSAMAQEIIARQVGQITRLVDDLLDVSRITLGKIALKLERVELGAVINQAVETTRTMLEKHRHELRLSLPNSPVHVWADSVRLAQVVANLLNNAAKYTDPGGKIELIVAQDSSDVFLVVRDNGSGIAPELLQRIFDLFTQGQNKFVTAQEGLGIGLTLVKRLIELHGGTVEARSAGLNQGSEFIVRLPALVDDSLEDSINAPSSPEMAPLRILVVEDNIDAADCLAQVLTMWGHTVQVAHDGETAITVGSAFAPNAVLLDLGLPVLDGLEVARRLRQKHNSASLLLVAMTGFGQDQDRLRSAEAGFDRHFTKPIDLESLRALLGLWAGRRQEPLSENAQASS